MAPRHPELDPPELRFWKPLKALSIIILTLGAILAFAEIASSLQLHLLQRKFEFGVCHIFSGLWVGVLGIVCGGLGIDGFRSKFGHKCSIIGHLTLAIIVALLDGFLLVASYLCLSSFWDGLFNLRSPRFPSHENAYYLSRGLFASECFKAVSAVAQCKRMPIPYTLPSPSMDIFLHL